MKVEFFENENGSRYSLVPETPEEVGQLARVAMNSKKEKPSISLYLTQGSVPYMSIWIRKLETNNQKNSISN